MWVRLPHFAMLAVGLTACVGEIGDPVSSRDAAGSEGEGAALPGDTPRGEMPRQSACVDGQIQPGTSPLRRLTQTQYANTIRDLFGPSVTAGTPLQGSIPVGVYRTAADANAVSGVTAELLFDESARVAAQAVASSTFYAPCDLDAAPATADACLETRLRTFADRAWRRPLSSEEAQAVVTLYRTLRTRDDVRNALQGVLEVLLQSPQFLYLSAEAVAVPGSTAVQQLDGYSIASRLSYLLWDTMPDDALFQLAASGGLSRLEDVAARAELMLADPRARSVVRAFHDDWLMLAEPDALQRDPATYPEFDASVATALYEETNRFVDHVMWSGDARLASLLTSRTVFANDRVSDFYGLSTGSTGPSDWRAAEFPAEQRGGVLTRAAFLMNRAHTVESAPIQRGVFVLRRMLCVDLEVPNDVDTQLPEDEGPTDTVRDKLARHRSEARCASCHDAIDPLGLAFENFDAVGEHRTLYSNGAAVDATGAYYEDQPFRNAVELVTQLSTDPEVHSCYAVGWFNYVLGRGVTDDDACSLERATDRFAATQGDIKQLILALVQSDAFRFRPTPILEEQ